jgi:NAD(P)-dependent dehydrogenase (short-subunit alcohol dehydrogenase family)
MSTDNAPEVWLAGKVAIVTGGTRGIGLAVARDLAAAGASVVASGLRERSVARAREELAVFGGRFRPVVADVRRAPDVEALMRQATDGFGGLDILVNNAGIGRFVNVSDMTVETWSEMIDTNLTGVFLCSRAAIPIMRARGGGWIVNVSSLAGRNSFAGGAAYCATKAGLNGFTESLMEEVRFDGIRVSLIVPGSVATEFSGHAVRDEDAWKLAAADVSQAVMDLLRHPARSLPSRVEIRPAVPRRTRA